jgi:Xaa-Pro dipeptidase
MKTGQQNGMIQTDYTRRMETLQQGLRDNGWKAALIMQPRDVYYYAGTAQPANLWVPDSGTPILFTRRAHEMAAKATAIEHIERAGGFKDIVKVLKEVGLAPSTGEVIGIEQDVLPYGLVQSIKRSFEGVSLKNTSALIQNQRFIKDEQEISKIRNAVELWDKGHQAVIDTLQPGMTEHEVAAAMESAARRGGGDGTVWFRRWDACLPGGGIVTSGPNAWIVSGHAMTVTGIGLSEALPWGASSRKLESGDLVVVDFGICREGYHCDIARTYSVGRPTDIQKDLWKRLLDLHFQVIDRIRPGVTGQDLYLFAEELAKKEGMEENFMGVGQNRGAYIGHSIGLELDEAPVIGLGAHDPLPVNAVITIEPKFMVPGRGAVMVEDDILVTDKGHEIISAVDRELYYF